MNSEQMEIVRLGRKYLEACAAITGRDCGEPLMRVCGDAELWRLARQPMSAPLIGGNKYLRRSVLEKFTAAATAVRDEFGSRFKILVVDAYRPPAVQIASHAAVKTHYRLFGPRFDSESELEAFVNSFSADPRYGGHPCGAAVDATLWDTAKNRRADPGSSSLKTIFVDALKDSAGNDSVEAAELRRRFSECFTSQGFMRTPCEWWHFSYGDYEWAQLTGGSETLYQPVGWRPEMLLGKKKIDVAAV